MKSEACPREGLPSHGWFLPVGTFLWESLASVLDPRLGTESSAQSAEKRDVVSSLFCDFIK